MAHLHTQYFVVQVLGIFALSTPVVHAQGPPKPPLPGSSLEVKMAQPLTVPALDIVATTVEIILAPGDPGAPAHQHPGPVVGYVVEGEFLQQLEGEPFKILKAGSAFYELDRAIHVWGANANNHTTCKVIATSIGRPGEDIMMFLPDYKRKESYEEALALGWKHYNDQQKMKALNL